MYGGFASYLFFHMMMGQVAPVRFGKCTIVGHGFHKSTNVNGLEDPLTHLFKVVQTTRHLAEDLFKIIDPVIQRNPFFVPENMLLAMAADEKLHIGELAYRRIIKATEQTTNNNERNLPFYHQNDYDVVFERVDVEWYNKSYCSNVSLHPGWYNRTVRAVNASFFLLRDIGTDLVGTVQAYKFMSNEYRLFPLTVSCNICEEYKNNNFRVKDLLKNISNIHDCPMLKGYYYVRSNGVQPDTSTFPPFIPRGSYKAHGSITHKKGIALAEVNVYVSVKDKPGKWN